MTEAEFINLVLRKTKKGMSFIASVYKALSEVVEAQSQSQPQCFACHKGCSACCHQLVTSTEAEFDEIITYILSLPRRQRDTILNRARKRAAEYQQWLEQHQLTGTVITSAEKIIWANEYWDGKPCAFLDESGNCRVYPARPIDCRTYHSTSVCQNPTWSDVKRFVWPAETWANNLILEQGSKAQKFFGVVPLLHWLLIKSFKKSSPK
ncbi:MAG: hypothetical protein A2729_00660 [Candidatus Buchananbacteria bacterium RIFCSPHIGHO2_01_FULL_39_14]|uniref:Zinc/iron-chelating domain-containing protein n=2 Tax=Candidatus Buchananiibacteriota TaxID=1817903 RepID=A0A1G1YQA6_9BACT|nr:MAG: hypothetical protein A2729_00660 [Candidatus Buchananbacteria bacterium RIFCSPHIGHO2_01_FULL_39_14]OGY48693.1 MAG: hypothetical protein A3D39_04445 [Candidatus Buchananbacteria bacterium RIFCSPHIGHO2_02_FULL_39_17]OGY54532.1 MAG: hypothetical protein A2912_00270 [Candidatus Buchananbacteria bacterium RIFCSPLOWO2_01_FULL_40_23b]